MTRAAMLRLERGRHRTATWLAVSLIALGVAGPIAGAAADGLATSIVVGALVRELARLLQHPATLIILSALCVLRGAVRVHPAANVKYAAALATTPWQPGRPLPGGEMSVTSSFVLLPALACAVMWIIGLPTPLWITVGATIGYAVAGITAATLTGAYALMWTIVLVLLALPPALSVEAWLAGWASVTAALVLASRAQHGATRKALRDGAVDLLRVNLQKRANLGWLTQLPLAAPPRHRAARALAAITAGATLASIAFALQAFRGEVFRLMLSYLAVALVFTRLVGPLAAAPLSFGPIARVLTGRWYVARMDRHLLLPAAALLVWFILIRLHPWEKESQLNSLVGGGFMAGMVLTALWLGPTRLEWQATGASRIPVAPSGPQKQAEANLRRVVGT